MASNDTRRTRREMLKLAGSAMVGVIAAGCGATATPTASPPAPTQTARVVEVTKVVTQQVPVPVTQVVEKVVTPTPKPLPAGAKKQLNFWSMWSTQPLNQQFVNTVVNDFNASRNDAQINVSYWEKAALESALKAALTAGEGAPDLSGDVGSALFAQSGWLLDLSGALPEKNFRPGILQAASLAEPKGLFSYPIGIQILYLFYNPKIFAEAGVTVPASQQFTQDEFVDVVKKVAAKGYSGFANAVGDRNYPAIYPIWAALTQLVGIDLESKINGGQEKWDRPEVRQTLEWMNQLRDAGAWPKSFATMGIDAFHTYFHTQQKAAMLYIGSFYPARAFKAVSAGGQSPDFHFGALKYPLMKGAKYPDSLWTSFDSGFMATKATKYPDVVKDFFVFMSQPKYGALWSALTTQPSTVLFDATKDWPKNIADAAQWQWYWDVIAKTYGNMQTPLGSDAPCAGYVDVRTSMLNQGLPQNLVTIDEAIKKLDANLCKK